MNCVDHLTKWTFLHLAKGHMKKMTGRGPKNRDIDQSLFEWYSQRRAAGERPRSCEVSTSSLFHKIDLWQIKKSKIASTQ